MRINPRQSTITSHRSRARNLLVAASIAAGLSLMVPASASAEPIKPLTTDQKNAVLQACANAGGSFRTCCKTAGGAYDREEDENGNVIDEGCYIGRNSGKPVPARINPDLTLRSPVNNPKADPHASELMVLRGGLGTAPIEQSPPPPPPVPDPTPAPQ